MANLGLGVPEGSRSRTTIEELPGVLGGLKQALLGKLGGYPSYANVCATVADNPLLDGSWLVYASYREHGSGDKINNKTFRGVTFDAAADAMRAWLAVDEVALGYLTLGLGADGRLPADTLDDVAGRR